MREIIEKDPFAKLLGMYLIEGGEGFADVGMLMAASHTNFLGGGHGGAIFALADMAFGLASNSRERIGIGIDAHIAYLRGASEGQTLVAKAREINRGRKTAVYRVEVLSEQDVIAAFTGTVHITDRPVKLAECGD